MGPHQHEHHVHGKGSTGNIRYAFFLNLGFTMIEVIGGLLTNSLAILSDALHDAGDCLSLGLSWYFQGLSDKKRDATFSYGYKRFSLLGAVINAIVLVVGSLFIINEAIPRIIEPETVNPQGMFLLAILGVIVNGLAVIRLQKGTSINERVVSLHLLEDVLGWLAVLLGSGVMMFFDIPVVDPILSVLIAGFILFNVYKNLKESFKVFLQAIPEDVNINDIKSNIIDIEGIRDVHDTHIWSLDGEYNILTIHLVLDNNYGMDQVSVIKKKVKEVLKDKRIDHFTIETETESEECDLRNVH